DSAGGEDGHDRDGNQSACFFAPVVRGGIAGIVARPGMGQLVIVAELIHRFREKGMKTVFFAPEQTPAVLEESIQLADAVTGTAEETIEALRTSGTSAVLFADKGRVDSGEFFRVQEETGPEPVTAVLVDLTGSAVDEDFPFGPLETVWQLDAELAARQLYPAVSPLYSTSSILEEMNMDERHFQLRLKVQKVMRRYRELRAMVQVRGEESVPEAEKEIYRRGEHLEAYFTQPFYTAEEFTEMAGVSVPLTKVLTDVEAILNGQTDRKSTEDLKFTGALS
uniref:ATP synthase beta subunit C-terminal domain-containing protein n=1 Tax=Indiicoccus explosivorum TaxID=1917864 RepID=UPI0013904B25